MTFFIRIFISIIIFSSLVVLGITFFFGFENILDYFLEVLNKSHKKEDALNTITPFRFYIIQLWILISIVFEIFLFMKANLFTPYIETFFIYIKSGLRAVLNNINNKYILIILVIPIISSIYYGLTMPISYDEAYTYLFFTSKPFYLCLFYYPAPNNHVLHSLITNITDCIPFISTLFALRLPAIISAAATSLIAFSFVKRFYSEKTAVFVVSISSVLSLYMYYSYLSRGYAMMVLLFIISLYSVYSICKNGSNNKYWLFFTLGSILGLYTIPTYLYCYLTLNVILLIFNLKDIRKFIICNLSIGLIILLLYLPFILVNGLNALISNEFVERKSWLTVIKVLPDFILETSGIIFGIPYQIVILLFIVSGILLYVRNKKFEFWLWVIFSLAPFVLLAIQSVIPFNRTFIYYGFIITFFLGISISGYIEKIPYKYLIPILICIQIMALLNFNKNVREYEYLSFYSKEINENIIDEGKTYYLNNSLGIFNHQFELASRGIDYNKVAIYDWDTDLTSADTLNNYDYVLIDRETDVTRIRKPFLSNNLQNVYKRE